MPNRPEHPLIVFDFDGVIADSEWISNEVLAAELSAAGMPTTPDDSIAHYMGRNWQDTLRAIEERWRRPPPDDFRPRVRAAYEKRITESLAAVPGAADFIDRLAPQQRCIASSSEPDAIERHLAHMGLAGRFEGRIFSAAVHVPRGKPHPDIYIHAVAAMGGVAEESFAIEDSERGVTAAAAAGLTVIGLCAGRHIPDGHGERLRAAGARHIANSYREVAAHVLQWLTRGEPTETLTSTVIP